MVAEIERARAGTSADPAIAAAVGVVALNLLTGAFHLRAGLTLAWSVLAVLAGAGAVGAPSSCGRAATPRRPSPAP
jgi:hypothetical protein